MLVEQWRANFWNPDWEGAKPFRQAQGPELVAGLPREMHRFLLATFKKASEEFCGRQSRGDGRR